MRYRPDWKIGFACAAAILFSRTVPAQVILEDWSCPGAASVSNSRPAVVTCQTPHGLPAKTVAGQPWVFHLQGGTGAWSVLNGFHRATILGPDRFSIPVDTSGAGPFAGQKITILRGTSVEMQQDVTSSGYAGFDGNSVRPLPGNALEVTVPGGYVGTGYRYGRAIDITDFTVRQGVATIQLAAPLPETPPEFKVMPGREIHFRNFAEQRLNSKRAENGKDTPHYVATIGPGRTSLTVAVKVPDGSYGPAGNQRRQLLVQPPNAFNFLYFTRQTNVFPYPAGRVSNYVKNPPLPPTVNRLTLWIQWPRTVRRRADGGMIGSVGTYAKHPRDPEDRAERFHLYHYFDSNQYAGRWMQMVVNDTPQHSRGANGAAQFPNNPTRNGWLYYSGPGWDHQPFDYLPNLTYFYVDAEDGAKTDLSEQKYLIGPITMDTVRGEPDALVSLVTGVWSPDRLDGRGPGYEIAFNTPKFSRDTYEIRYSTKGSLKEAGFSAGTSAGMLKGLDSAYTGLMWSSPPMKEENGFWVGIRPHIAIVGVSKQGVAPIVIVTRAAAMMADGDLVTVQGVAGNSAANVKKARITNRPAPLWQLGHGLDRIEVANNVATVYLTQAHGLVPGQVIEIYGSKDEALGGGQPNRLYTVQSTPAPNTFTFNTAGVKDGVYKIDMEPAAPLGIQVLPSFSVPGTGSGDFGGGACAKAKLCAGAGTVVSDEERKNFTEMHMYPFKPELADWNRRSAKK